MKLAPLLPAFGAPPAEASLRDTAAHGPSHTFRSESTMGFAKKAVLCFLLDRSVEKVAGSTFRGRQASRLANLLSGFGGRPIMGVLALGYLAASGPARRSYGTAFEAAGEAMLITDSLKFVIGRMRPGESGSDPDEFRGLGSGYGSFPSGHTSNAFALATVLAKEHPKHKWLYYALATGVGLARVQQHEHFLSDVFVGAAIGTYAGNQAIKGRTLFGKQRRLHGK